MTGCGGRVPLIRSTHNLLIVLYSAIILPAPGYIVRDILNSMIALCNNKNMSTTCRDCAMQIISFVMRHKSSDCGNQITEVLQLFVKLGKSSEMMLRSSALRGLCCILTGCGDSINDLHPEMMKFALRFSSDKSVEVRCLVAQVLMLIADHSAGVVSVSADGIIAAASRGLEDDTAAVQDAYAAALATVLYEQMRAFAAGLEAAKLGQARDSDSDQKTPVKKPTSRLSLAKLSMSSQKKVAETFEFRKVVGNVLKQLVRSNNQTLRNGYIATVDRLLRKCLLSAESGGASALMSAEDLGWFINALFDVLRDAAVTSLSFEESAYLRARLSHMMRSALVGDAAEKQLSALASHYAQYLSNAEDEAHRPEIAVLLALMELSHTISLLGTAAAAVAEEAHHAATAHLRHASFAVRAAAASVVASAAVSTPCIAVDYLRGALFNTSAQAKQLMQFDESEAALAAGGADDGDIAIDASGRGFGSSSSEHGSSSSGGSQKMKTRTADELQQQQRRQRSNRELERQQRMFFFHGHSLVISIVLRNAKKLPNGLPTQLVQELLGLGVQLLSQDVFATPVSQRHISCSIVRAGSLIVSSCLSLGYAVVRPHVVRLLRCCNKIFDAVANSHIPAVNPAASAGTPAGSQLAAAVAAAAAGDAAGVARADEVVYEIMSAEAALVCISALVQFCPQALLLDAAGAGAGSADSEVGLDSALQLVVHGLEVSFRALKSKYQPRLRSHFRFRTLHVMLLECYAALPPRAYPNSCQQIYVEALRVFRDGVAASFECSCIQDFVAEDYRYLRVGGGQAGTAAAASVYPGSCFEAPMPERLLMLRLETHAVSLQKKESEAFLAIYTGSQEEEKTIVQSRQFRESVLQEEVMHLVGSAEGSSLWFQHRSAAAARAHLDTRTMDSAMRLLAATYSFQTAEYKDKAVQLCGQAIAQFVVKPSGSGSGSGGSSKSLGLFSSDEERRRKERKNGITNHSVAALLAGIAFAYQPRVSVSSSASDDAAEQQLQWQKTAIDLLFDMLAHPSYALRSCSAQAIALFASKQLLGGEAAAPGGAALRGSMLDSISNKIRGQVMSVLSDKKAEPGNEHAGFLVVLSALWRYSACSNDVQSVLLTVRHTSCAAIIIAAVAADSSRVFIASV